MNRLLSFFLFLITSSVSFSQNASQTSTQTVAHVDKKTKEFFVTTNPKAEYKIFGYEYPNITTRKMICFSSYTYDVGDNLNKCPLGSYFDSGKMKEGDRIIYVGKAGSFSKMTFISGSGKKTLFYFPKGSFTIK
ncbi:MAG TPA: hypothetical protein VGZ90_06370 [Puia sp.]|jgi:hypothetical protein|nr:hypothetical protein [Puia sp.]